MMKLGQGHQRGQSLTEFLALCLALVPLFLLVPMLARYQDMVHSAQMASRYIAFDAMNRNEEQGGWKSAGDLKQEATRRLLASSTASVKANDSAGNYDGYRNLFWRDVANNPLIRDFGTDVAVGFGQSFNASRTDETYQSASDGAAFNQGVLHVANTMDLPVHGIYTAGIEISVANLPGDLRLIRPFNNLDLKIRSKTSLVVNGWSAKNPPDVDARINHVEIFPGLIAKPANVFIGGAVEVVELGNVPRPSIAKLALWEDVVPADRLVKRQP